MAECAAGDRAALSAFYAGYRAREPVAICPRRSPLTAYLTGRPYPKQLTQSGHVIGLALK